MELLLLPLKLINLFAVRYRLLFVLWVSSLGYGWSQEITDRKKIIENGREFLLYEVKPGETLYSISKKFDVPLQEIRDANPTVTSILKTGQILKISSQEFKEISALFPDHNKPLRYIRHEVRKKETLYSISRRYGITQENIFTANPGLTRLKRGVVLLIPQWTLSGNSEIEEGTEPVRSDSVVTHWVQPGETLYSISRKYGKPIAWILEANPGANDLKSGMRITIPMHPNAGPVTPESTESDGYHTVHAGETLYSISRQYGTTPERLAELNPGIAKNLPAGARLLIPKIEKPAVPEMNPQEGPVLHIVKGGETLYGISQRYKTPMTEMVRSNPYLEKRSPRVGDTIKVYKPETAWILPPPPDSIPGKSDRSEQIPDDRVVRDCSEISDFDNQGKPLTVVLLLPVMINENLNLNKISRSEGKDSESESGISGTLSSSSEKVQFHGNSENFIHFYEGVLLAVDSLQQMGIRINLKIYDTEQKPSRIRNLVASGNLNDARLIIGPVFPSEQKEISDFCLKNKIPVISPLSASEELTSVNPYFVQVNPSREYIARRTALYVASSFNNCNLLVIQTGNSDSQAESAFSQLKEELTNSPDNHSQVRICNFRKEGYVSLKEMMVKDRKNVILIPSTNEADVSVVVSNIKALADTYDLTLVGNNRFPQFESIDPDYYHQGQLEYLTPFWPDYSLALTRAFDEKFRHYFRAEPNQFSMQGYDVAFYFIKALDTYGKDFRNCLPHFSEQLVQGKYYFQQTASGGFSNEGLSVVLYTRDYQIIRKKSLTNLP